MHSNLNINNEIQRTCPSCCCDCLLARLRKSKAFCYNLGRMSYPMLNLVGAQAGKFRSLFVRHPNSACPAHSSIIFHKSSSMGNDPQSLEHQPKHKTPPHLLDLQTIEDLPERFSASGRTHDTRERSRDALGDE